jgi:hypothetical protein
MNDPTLRRFSGRARVVRLIIASSLSACWLLGGSIGMPGRSPGAAQALTTYHLSVWLYRNGTGVWQTIDPDTLVADGNIDCRRSGGATSGKCGADFVAGTTVWYKLVPATGSTASESDAGPYQSLILSLVVMNESIARLGYFQLDTEDLSISITGTGGGHVNNATVGNACPTFCSGHLFYGTAIVLTAVPDTGSAFAGWSGGVCAGTNTTCSFSMTSSATVNAEFRLILGQTLTFAQPSSGQVGGKPVPLSATASSGLPVSFTSGSPAICTLSGSSALPVAPGTCSITAHQAGNAFYYAAADVTRTFSIAPKPTAEPTPSAATRGPQATGGTPPTSAVTPGPNSTTSVTSTEEPSASQIDISSAPGSSTAAEPIPSTAPAGALSTGGDPADGSPPWLALIAVLIILAIGTNLAIFQVMRARRSNG